MHYEQSGAPALGALASVARRHGVDLNVDGLRASYVDLTDGMPTATLIAIENTRLP